jgi:asparagine synthase (glutamine-hydrolysing)
MHELGIQAKELDLTNDFLCPGSLPDLQDLADDSVAAISRLESTMYQGNMLLRDGDANGMANSLEIRLPLLGQQVLQAAHGIPGSQRLPAGSPSKYLLRAAFPELLRDEVVNKRKMGFTLPIRVWMRTALRSRCQTAINALKDYRIFHPAGIDSVMREFENQPNSPSWSRAFSLCVLGDYVSRYCPSV